MCIYGTTCERVCVRAWIPSSNGAAFICQSGFISEPNCEVSKRPLLSFSRPLGALCLTPLETCRFNFGLFCQLLVVSAALPVVDKICRPLSSAQTDALLASCCSPTGKPDEVSTFSILISCTGILFRPPKALMRPGMVKAICSKPQRQSGPSVC